MADEESRDELARRCVGQGKAEAVQAFCDSMGIPWSDARAAVAAGLSSSGLRGLFDTIRRDGRWPAKVDPDEFPYLMRTWFRRLGLEWTQEQEEMATQGDAEARRQLLRAMIDGAAPRQPSDCGD